MASKVLISPTKDMISSMTYTIEYNWEIENFFYIRETMIESPTFGSTEDDITWKIVMYPRAKSKIKYHPNPYHIDRDRDSHIMINLSAMDMKHRKIIAKFSFSIVDSFGYYHCNDNESVFTFSDNCSSHGCNNMVYRDTLSAQKELFLPNDRLTIHCEVTIIKSMEKDYFRVGIETIFNEKDYTDIAVVTDDAEFEAHKIVLAAHSPVFKAMFSHESLIENEKNSIQIIDIRGEIVKEMLQFCYSGTVRDLGTNVKGLLVAAEKYHIRLLKQLCERFLSETISRENVIAILIFADMHYASELRRAAFGFIIKNFNQIQCADDWKQLKKDQPQLCVEICEKVIEENDSPPEKKQKIQMTLSSNYQRTS